MSEGAPQSAAGRIAREYQAAAVNWAWSAIRDLELALHPILGSLRREPMMDLPVDEVDESGLSQPPDFASRLFRPMKYEVRLTVGLIEVLSFDVDSFLTTLYDVADDVGGQKVKGMVDHISQICDDNEQVVDAGGDIFEGILRSLETIDIEFNEDGSHNLQLLVHPDTAAGLAGKTPTQDQIRRGEEILERRQREWRDSRRRRELPEFTD